MTPQELLNERIRRDLRRKQRELADEVALLLTAPASTAQAYRRAIQRKEKSIALLTAKLLCQHEVERRDVPVNRAMHMQYRCTRCKAFELCTVTMSGRP